MYNLLICDDERDIRNALKIYLSGEGYKIFEAENGEEALSIASSEEIHLVLMDIMMPRMNGIEAVSKIREFSTGTPASDAVCQIKQGGVLSLTLFSRDQYVVFSPLGSSSWRRFLKEPL